MHNLVGMAFDDGMPNNDKAKLPAIFFHDIFIV